MKIIKINSYRDIFNEVLAHFNADGYKLFYLASTEELKILKMLREIANVKKVNMYIYDIANGLSCKDDNRVSLLSNDALRDIEFVLFWLQKNAKGIAVFLDIDNLLYENYKIKRAFKNTVNYITENNIYLKFYLVFQYFNIPQDLQIESYYFDIPFPNRDEIENSVKTIVERFYKGNRKDFLERFIGSLTGLREQDIKNIIKYVVTEGELSESSISIITEFKVQSLKRQSLLEFVTSKENISSLGGMKNLKEWLDKKSKVIANLKEANDFGVDTPKGILLFGVPGCGKSLAAKVIASSWNLPLIRLDMGVILGPYLGQSEENIRKAIKIAESMAPCVLWIDEIEKAFSGVGPNGDSHDVLKRVFGTFLTWMQERDKPVFVVATANDISGMPPEFLRKGRFDEIFFVDLPDKENIKEILRIHLKKRKHESWYSQVEKYINRLSGFSGADIEAVANELVERAFIDESFNESKLSIYMEDILKEFNPISQSLKTQIAALKEKLKSISAKPVD